MRRRRKIEVALNVATMTMLALALGAWTRSCLGGSGSGSRPTGAASHVPDSVGFEALASGDTLRMAVDGPALYLVFRSTCPACGQNLRFWRGLISRLPRSVQAFAVALEGGESGRAFARRHLTDALAVRPLRELEFVRDFGIAGVPSTLLIDATGHVRLRYTGLLDAAAVTEIVRLARTASSR